MFVKKTIVSFILILTLAFSMVGFADIAEATVDRQAVGQFVARLYVHALGRSHDTAGLEYWINNVVNGMTGAEVARGFFNSNEFLARSMTNDRYLDLLYMSMLNRAADAPGKAYWHAQFNAGLTRNDVLAGFVVSNEFTGLCAQYGITRGTLDASAPVVNPTPATPSTPTVPTANVAAQTQFLTRLYRQVLGREPDQAGLNYWLNLLANGTTGADVVYGFFFSHEFVRSNHSNSRFLDILYSAIFNRAADAAGKNYWLNHLSMGFPRENIIAGFTVSNEFTALCNSFGIVRGTYVPPPGAAERVYVTHLYRTMLGREANQSDLNYWVNMMLTGTTAAVVAYNVLFSNEFTNRNLSNERFIDVLYLSMLNRAADAAGRAGWLHQLNLGTSRYDIFVSFVNSNDFDRLCREYGIIKGTAPPPANMMTSNTNVARVWNHIVKAHFRGISDRPEHIAAIIGNMQAEAGSNLCPFQVQLSNHRGLGLMQWTDPTTAGGRRTQLEAYMWSNGISRDAFYIELNKHSVNPFYCNPNNPLHQHPQEFLDRVIEVQINFMFHEFRNGERNYLNFVDFPTSRTGVAGARAYAELFCALSLRPGDGGATNNILDAGVLNALRASAYVGGVGNLDRISYSNLSGRRNNAEAVYQQFLRNHN